MSRYNVYKPIDNLYIMIIKNFIWGMCGIILGIIINNTVIFLSKEILVRATSSSRVGPLEHHSANLCPNIKELSPNLYR